MADSAALIDQVLDFWFGPPGSPEHGKPRQQWWVKNPAFDEEIRRRFAEHAASAAAGDYDGLAETSRGALALVILLDQFPRNLHRGSAKSFATDAKALAVMDTAIEEGLDQELDGLGKTFLYMPGQHSEDLGVQERTVELFKSIGVPDSIAFAEEHRDIIARFGRFPHRNAVLGRETTPEEAEFLKDFDSFG